MKESEKSPLKPADTVFFHGQLGFCFEDIIDISELSNSEMGEASLGRVLQSVPTYAMAIFLVGGVKK